MAADAPLGGLHVVASCLAHRRRVFVQHWPHKDGTPYRWVHTNLSPCPGLPEQDQDAVTVPADAYRWGTKWSFHSPPLTQIPRRLR